MAVHSTGDFLRLCLGQRQPKTLPVNKVEGDAASIDSVAEKEKKEKIVVVLLHGMWHDASWYSKLQQLLQQRGYASYAVDLLAGERFLPGFSQREIVADLEHTLLPILNKDVEAVFVGHSQGGLVVQSCMKNSQNLRTRTRGLVLLGTYPLGLLPPAKALLQQPRHMYSPIMGYLGICFMGKLISLDYLKHIFLLPTTDASALADYTSKLLRAPSDGLITTTHFLGVPQDDVDVISTKPTLALGAKEDIIYPPHMLSKDFDDRFPNATHRIIPKQAHCFMDSVSAEDTDMEDSMIKWLDSIV